MLARVRRAALLAAVLLLAAGAAVELSAGSGARVRTGSGDAHGAKILRYSLKGRGGRVLPQVAIRPAKAGAKPPLLVFLHGRGGLREESNANGAFLRALAGLGSRAPAVVFPSGDEASYWHDRRDGHWDAYVIHQVIPAAIRRLHADPRRVAIGGISMGGFGAYDIALHHPGRFCAVGGHSAAVWTAGGLSAPGAFDDGADFARNDVIAAARAHGRHAWRGIPLWLDNGSADPFRAADHTFAAALGIHQRIWPGGHDDAYWHAHYGSYLRFYAAALARC
jgi:S-formylglutathione hydrolase FrmB